MKSLPNVTLISYDNSAGVERTLRALQYCASLIQFGAVILVCSRHPARAAGIDVRVVPESGYKAAMVWEVAGINDYVRTDYALCIHYDGYILNPDKWNDAWFQYDFIGAPWPREPHPHHPAKSNFPQRRVGNTGFCLKSKAFMEETSQLAELFYHRHALEGNVINHCGLGGDTFCCQYERPGLEAHGIAFAPIDVAADFSWEDNIEEFPQGRPDAFGFHNFYLGGKTVLRLV